LIGLTAQADAASLGGSGNGANSTEGSPAVHYGYSVAHENTLLDPRLSTGLEQRSARSKSSESSLANTPLAVPVSSPEASSDSQSRVWIFVGVSVLFAIGATFVAFGITRFRLTSAGKNRVPHHAIGMLR
jgi:hypothetical protein